MPDALEMLAAAVDSLAGRVADLERGQVPGQGLDTTSTPLFTGINPGVTNSYVKNYRIAALANNGLAALVDGLAANGFLFVISPTDQTIAVFKLQGAGHLTAILVQDAAAQFTITATTAGKHNIYWSAGNTRYELENKIGGARSYDLLFFGE